MLRPDPNETLHLPEGKAFPNGMSPINARKKEGMKRVTKCNDSDRQDFSLPGRQRAEDQHE